MSDLDFVKTRLQAGVWEGELVLHVDVTEPPALAVSHLGQPVEGHTLEKNIHDEGTWVFRLPVPTTLLSDGVQTFVITHLETGDVLASFSIVAGEALDYDLRAEVDLLRAELEVLKRSFRRQFTNN